MSFKTKNFVGFVGVIVILLNECNFVYTEHKYVQSTRCPEATCQPAPKGVSCEPKYDDRDGGCCPEWHCSNGNTVYGIRQKTSYSQDWKSSWNSRDPSWPSTSLDKDSFFNKGNFFDRTDNRDLSWSSFKKDSLFDKDNFIDYKPKHDKLFDRYWRRRR